MAGDPIGTLATLLPTWALVPFLLAAILSLVSGAVLGIYSSGLTLLSLGVKLKRPQAAGVDGVLLTLGTIYVVFFADNFINPFQSFLITLGVPLAAWAGIMIADLAQHGVVRDVAGVREVGLEQRLLDPSLQLVAALGVSEVDQAVVPASWRAMVPRRAR